jgi:hypothetical protein
MDSRDYVCAFDINCACDAPADFELPQQASNAIAGVFLPQGEPDWLGRRKYPARMLLVTDEELWVIPHAAAGGRPERIVLRELETLECGRMLLLGWIGLHAGSVAQTLEYNQRSGDVVDRFVAGLKARWLRREPGVCRLPRQTFGEALDQKFDFAWSFEAIDEREQPLIRYFQPATRRLCRRFLFRRESWTAGDLLVVTDRRVLWITERHGTVYAPYGTVSRSAPLSALSSIQCGSHGAEAHLTMVLQSGRTWTIPAGEGRADDARNVAEAITKALACVGRNAPSPIRPRA